MTTPRPSLEADLAELHSLVGRDGLTTLDGNALADLQRSHPHLPSDYFRFLRDFGFGGLGRSRFMLYSGPVQPSDIFDPDSTLCRATLILVGDNFAGDHLGYVWASDAWRLCFFDHLCLGDPEPLAEGSIVRFFLSYFEEPDD